jgi:Domain of unknown function (DUF4234)
VEETAGGRVGESRSVGLTILWSILTLGIYTFFWTYWTFDELQRYRGRGLGGVLGLVIYIVCVVAGWIAIAIVGVLLWAEIKALYEEDGREAPHTPLWGLWLLLPVVGNFVWYIPTQEALNDFWRSKSAAPDAEEGDSITPA